MEIKTNNNIDSCKYHVVWCPKYRRKVLVGDVEQRLKELLQEVCDSRKAEIIELEIMPDHVHLLATVGGAPLSAIKQYIENQKRSQRE